MRLIDADALLERMKRTNRYFNVKFDIEEAPTIEAEPVRHGRWKEMHYEGGILDGTNFDRCSVCGYERVFNDPALKTVFKYCPNCGAKMDLEG